MEKVNRTLWREGELGRGTGDPRGGLDPGRVGTGTQRGAGLELGKGSDHRLQPPGRGSPGRRAGGVPRGRGAAPARRRRRRPLPDSRPPRVHSDFSAHFSSSPVTPALALPPPAAPPRSASRGNPRRSQPPRPQPGSAPQRPHARPPGPPLSPPDPRMPGVGPPYQSSQKWISPQDPQEGPSLGGSTEAGVPQTWGRMGSLALPGPSLQFP